MSASEAGKGVVDTTQGENALDLDELERLAKVPGWWAPRATVLSLIAALRAKETETRAERAEPSALADGVLRGSSPGVKATIVNVDTASYQFREPLRSTAQPAEKE